MVISVKKAFFVMSGLALVLMVSVLLIIMISNPVFVGNCELCSLLRCDIFINLWKAHLL